MSCLQQRCYLWLLNLTIFSGFVWPQSGALDRTGTLWSPHLEWQLMNPTFSGNPFDVIASATFLHASSGESITTGMFYAGNDTWRFRFTGTRTGVWNFTTTSEDADLDGHAGAVTIQPNPDPQAKGFMTAFGNRWGRSGTQEVFVPQYVMYVGPQGYYDAPQQIDQHIQQFMTGHGFSGFHTPVFCRWFDVEKERSDDIDVPNPDFRTFEALELLITKVYAAGGVVHIWLWGDESRRQTPVKWGKNGPEDRRLQRYIAARLGPLPGWSMGYGFDLDEWVTEADLRQWHTHMQEQFGWFHFLGGRASGPNNAGEPFVQIYEGLDYASYEQHRPDYERYVETIEARPNKPAFSEDRFRVRDIGDPKDYTFDDTRRGLWRSTMAGGVANIWGNILGDAAAANQGLAVSAPYPNAEQLRASSLFFKERFIRGLVRDNTITDGVCLRLPSNTHFLFYREDATDIALDLSDMANAQPAIAVDAKQAYAEIDLGVLAPAQHTWQAPRFSDWAIAVGDFTSVAPEMGALPELIDFGTVASGDTIERVLQVKNTGAAVLQVEALQLSGNHAAEFHVTETSFEVQPGDSQGVAVQLHGAAPGEKNAELQVLSNDPERRATRVRLLGQVENLNLLPTAEIMRPRAHAVFTQGARVDFGGVGITASGFRLPAANFIWTIDFPSKAVQVYDGVEAGSFVANEVGGYLISLRVVDDAGASGHDSLPVFVRQQVRLDIMPNPVNDGALFAYRLEQPSQVELSLYNTLGQMVKQIIDRTQSPGDKTIRWDGAGNLGTRVGSGVFFVRLTVDGRSVVRKLVVVR